MRRPAAFWSPVAGCFIIRSRGGVSSRGAARATNRTKSRFERHRLREPGAIARVRRGRRSLDAGGAEEPRAFGGARRHGVLFGNRLPVGAACRGAFMPGARRADAGTE